MPAVAKTVCPVSRQQFREKAPRIKVVIDGHEYTVKPKDFSTGSIGWNLNEKIEVEIDGTGCTCQVGLNITLVGSKDLPK